MLNTVLEPAFFALLGVIATTIATALYLSWWLSKQFSIVRQLVYTSTEKLQQVFLNKLEYHERHDDQRFQEVHNDLWTIRIRNAAKDGIPLNRTDQWPSERNLQKNKKIVEDSQNQIYKNSLD